MAKISVTLGECLENGQFARERGSTNKRK